MNVQPLRDAEAASNSSSPRVRQCLAAIVFDRSNRTQFELWFALVDEWDGDWEPEDVEDLFTLFGVMALSIAENAHEVGALLE
jgi:hypothetical protein